MDHLVRAMIKKKLRHTLIHIGGEGVHEGGELFFPEEGGTSAETWRIHLAFLPVRTNLTSGEKMGSESRGPGESREANYSGFQSTEQFVHSPDMY